MPDKVDELLARLEEYKNTMIEPDVAAEVKRGNPWNFGGLYSTGWCKAEPSELMATLGEEEDVDIEVLS